MDWQPALDTQLEWPKVTYIYSRKDQHCSKVWAEAWQAPGGPKALLCEYWGVWVCVGGRGVCPRAGGGGGFRESQAGHYCNPFFPHPLVSALPRQAFQLSLSAGGVPQINGTRSQEKTFYLPHCTYGVLCSQLHYTMFPRQQGH